jgi:uncharacterized membrane protein YdjX (TVP38/TMEM64 family)
MKHTTHPVKFLPLVILLIGFILFFTFGAHRYFSFTALKSHHTALLAWRVQHPFIAAFLFIVIYIVAVAFSFPGATLLTLIGGFLFGTLFGTLYVTIGATIGACIIFWAARTALAQTLSKKAGPFLKKLEAGFQKNAVSYLLFLRFVPVFPFWLINIVPGLLNVRLSTFFFTTLFGILPGTAVYAAVGNGLGSLLARGETPNFGVIFEPQIMIPLLLLALLSIIPPLYGRVKRGKQHGKN